jgi:hypothetical protein
MPRLFEYDYKPGEELTLRFHLGEAKPVSEETAQHLRNAVTEVLRAMRSGLDRAINKMEGEQPVGDEANGEDERHRRIDVE